MTLATLTLLTAIAVTASTPKADQTPRKNVLGGPLTACGQLPKTGYLRDGTCRAVDDDHGTHTVCAKVTQQFLDFTKARGNDLITPQPDAKFPGLKPNDRWCLCALRYKQALEGGVAPPVILEASDERTLQYVPLDALKAHVEDGQAKGSGGKSQGS